MIKARFGSDFDKVLHRVFPFLAAIRLRPDTLTVLGVLASLMAAAAFGTGYVRWGGLILVLSGFCDLIDGVVARSQGRSSSSGGFFDSTMDRLADLLVYCGIAVGMARSADVGGVLLVSWALIGSVMTSYVQARAERHLSNFRVGLMERGERVGVLALAAILGYLSVGLWVVAIGSTVTTIQRIVAARRLLREFDRIGRDPTSLSETAQPSP